MIRQIWIRRLLLFGGNWRGLTAARDGEQRRDRRCWPEQRSGAPFGLGFGVKERGGDGELDEGLWTARWCGGGGARRRGRMGSPETAKSSRLTCSSCVRSKPTVCACARARAAGRAAAWDPTVARAMPAVSRAAARGEAAWPGRFAHYQAQRRRRGDSPWWEEGRGVAGLGGERPEWAVDGSA